MKKFNLKPIGTLIIIFVFLFLAFGSSDEQEEKKTDFSSKDEFYEYVKNKSYSDLKESWGEGEFSEPWDASGTGAGDFLIEVSWDNVKVEGKSVKVMFTNSGLEKNNAGLFHGIIY